MNSEHRDGSELQEVDVTECQKRYDAWLKRRGLHGLSRDEQRKAIIRMHEAKFGKPRYAAFLER